jgi:hypothetical protein
MSRKKNKHIVEINRYVCEFPLNENLSLFILSKTGDSAFVCVVDGSHPTIGYNAKWIPIHSYYTTSRRGHKKRCCYIIYNGINYDITHTMYGG